ERIAVRGPPPDPDAGDDLAVEQVAGANDPRQRAALSAIEGALIGRVERGERDGSAADRGVATEKGEVPRSARRRHRRVSDDRDGASGADDVDTHGIGSIKADEGDVAAVEHGITEMPEIPVAAGYGSVRVHSLRKDAADDRVEALGEVGIEAVEREVAAASRRRGEAAEVAGAARNGRVGIDYDRQASCREAVDPALERRSRPDQYHPPIFL